MLPEAARVPAGDAIPHEVVGLTIKRGCTLARAWWEYLGLTQQEVAGRMGITQTALSQMEIGGARDHAFFTRAAKVIFSVPCFARMASIALSSCPCLSLFAADSMRSNNDN